MKKFAKFMQIFGYVHVVAFVLILALIAVGYMSGGVFSHTVNDTVYECGVIEHNDLDVPVAAICFLDGDYAPRFKIERSDTTSEWVVVEKR